MPSPTYLHSGHYLHLHLLLVPDLCIPLTSGQRPSWRTSGQTCDQALRASDYILKNKALLTWTRPRRWRWCWRACRLLWATTTLVIITLTHSCQDGQGFFKTTKLYRYCMMTKTWRVMKKRPRHFGKIATRHDGGRLVIETNLGFTEIYFVVDLLLVQADLNW